MVYHRFIENIKDLRIMFDGKLNLDIIMEWKYGQLEFWIEMKDHPYHKIFFNKPELVKRWLKRANDRNNHDEGHYREQCRNQKRPFIMPEGNM